jgi:ketosteroid isomerase-like protein
MKKFITLIFVMLFSVSSFAQARPELEKLVETEKAFAKTAETKGTKAAFLEFLADDAIVFNPTAANGKEVWRNRPESPSLLVWNPTYADISSNGALGYTTGDFSFYPKGKTGEATAFGQFFSVWQRQSDGNYKAVLDLGITHPKPATVESAWKAAPVITNNPDSNKPSATAAAQSFFEQAEMNGLSKAYKMFAAEDVRLLREGDAPFLGKKAALERVKKDKGTIKFSKRLFFVGGGDLAYLSDTYTLTKEDKSTVKGNFAQVWRLRNGAWQLVMDVWNLLPPEKKQ